MTTRNYKTVTLDLTWRSQYDIEVPVGWTWDGTLDSILEFDDMSSYIAELTNWDIWDDTQGLDEPATT